jgi:hypothetical protein
MSERVYPLGYPPYIFVGKKPVAVLFGEERVEVKSWRQVYAAVLARCNQDPACHERLLYLRNKAAGKVREFLSDKPDSMTRPLRIDDALFGEVHYGSQTLMHILTTRILTPAHFDYSGIYIVLKA